MLERFNGFPKRECMPLGTRSSAPRLYLKCSAGHYSDCCRVKLDDNRRLSCHAAFVSHGSAADYRAGKKRPGVRASLCLPYSKGSSVSCSIRVHFKVGLPLIDIYSSYGRCSTANLQLLSLVVFLAATQTLMQHFGYCRSSMLYRFQMPKACNLQIWHPR